MVEEAGLETDGMAETTSQLQAKLKALTDGKVDIMVDANSFKDTTQILREMAAEWENLTDVEQAAALELLGGKRQANTLAAILTNFDIVEDAIAASEGSAGSALAENEKVLDSIEGKVQKFKNSTELFWSNLLDDEVIKFFVDLGTAIVKLSSWLGELESVIFAILMYFNMSKKYPFDLASLIFGPDGINRVLKGLGVIKSFLHSFKKTEAPLGLYPPGLPASQERLGLPAPQTGLVPYGPTSLMPIDSMSQEEKTSFFANMINNARMAAQNISQLFMNMINKLKTASSNIFIGAFDTIKTKVGSFTNQIKKAYYKVTNQTFMTNKSGKAQKTQAVDRRMSVYQGSDSADSQTAFKVSQMWQNHIARLRDSIGRVKQDFSTVWQHHNERVSQSVKYASIQFNKLKASTANTFGVISNITSNVANKMKNTYGKATDFMNAKILSINNAFVKNTSKAYTTDESGKAHRVKVGRVLPSQIPSIYEPQEQSYSRVNETINKIKDNIRNTVESGKWMFTDLASRVSQQFNTIKTSIDNSLTGAFGGLRNSINKTLDNISNVATKTADKVKNIYNKATDTMKSKITSVQNDFVKATSKAYTTDETGKIHRVRVGKVLPTTQPTIYEQPEQSYSKVDEAINRIRINLRNTIDNGKWMFEDLAARVGYQFNKIRTNIGNTVSSTFNNIRSNVESGFNKTINSVSTAFNKIKSKFGRQSSTSLVPFDDRGAKQSYSGFTATAKKVSAEVNRIWAKHIDNLNGSFKSVQNEFTRIWANHKVRVADSVAHAKSQFASMAGGVSAQFANMRAKMSPVFNWITNTAQAVSTKTKSIFGKIADPIVSGFQKATAKMKGFAGDVSKAFKQRLGYDQAPVATGPSMFDSLAQVQGKKLSMYDGGMTEANTAAIFDTANQKAQQGEAIFQKYITTMEGGNDGLKAYLASLNGGKATMAGYNKFLQEHNAGVKASGIAAKVAGIGHMFLNMALSMGMSMILSTAISAIGKLINKNKELAESVREAMAEIENSRKELKEHYDTIQEIKDDYADLANGVDDLGRNISLSTDEYKRYNEIVNQIASMFPEMVSGYTEEGNAIIALKGNVEALEEAYKKEAEAARDAILIKQNDVFDNFKNNTTESQSWFGARSGKSKQKDLSDVGTLMSGNEEQIENLIDEQGSSAVRQLLKDAGIKFTSFDDTVDVVKENMASIQAYYRKLKGEIEAEAASVRTVLNAYLQQDWDYLQMSDEGKKLAQSIISGFDTEFYSQFDSAAEMEAWVTTNVIQPLQNTANLEQVELTFGLQTKFNNGEISVDEYIKQIKEMLKQLEPVLGKEVVTNLRTVFGIESYETKKKSAEEILDSEGDKKVGTLSKEDLDIIDKNKTKWKEEFGLDDKTQMSWKQLTEKIAEAKKEALSTGEAFDEMSKKVDEVQDIYNTLADAAEEYSENGGYVNIDTLQELLKLEPKYLAMLYDENGQLNLNKDAILNVARARVEDMGVQAALSAITQAKKAIEEQDISTLKTLTETTYNQADATWALVQANLAALKTEAEKANIDPSNALYGQLDGVYEKVEGQVNAIKNLTLSASRNIGSSLRTGGSSGSKGKTALEKIQEKYEHQIKDLENQQTYIENEIEKLEAQEEGVSADYYEKQIDLEEEKIALYEQERAELLKLKRTDEVADAIWEVEHAIQESTLRMIEFRKSIAELYATASERITEAYDRRQQLSDDRTSFIENEISIRETKGELIPTSAYDELIAEAQASRANAEAELNAQADLYWQGINNGDFEEGSDEALDIIEKIRQKKLDMQEASKQEAEYIEQQKDAYIAYYDKMMEMYSHRNDFIQGQSDFAQSYIDRLGVLNINVPDEAYEKIAEIQELSAAGLREQLEFANSELAKFEAQGIDKNDPRYIEKFNEALTLEKEIYDKETEVYETHQQIFDNQIDRFNQVIDRINDTTQKLQNISGLLEREDVATEDGEWTAEGLTQLGMAYQQMEYYKQSADEVAEKIAEVTEAYENGEISEKKYYETMQELEGQQWDAINSYEDMKDTIVDLNEARIDMIEQGLDKEIEAMQELIDLKKEELESERALYEFKEDVEDQQKSIASLQRRIASMSGSTDASTIAERTKLQQELREAEKSLDSTYRNHAYDSMSDALDNEMESYSKSSEDYLEQLRESIKDTDLLIETTFTDVMQNGQIVLETLTTLSNTYGIQLDGYLTSPWKNATSESLNFETYATSHFNAVYDTVETKTSDLTGYTKAPWEAGEGQAKTFNEKSIEYMNGVVTHAETEYKTQLQEKLDYPWLQANGQASWGKGVKGVLDQAVKDAQEAGRKIAEALDVETPSYKGADTSGTNNTGGYTPKPAGGSGDENIKQLQRFLNTGFGAGLKVDGIDGPATRKAVEDAQRKVYSYLTSIGYRNPGILFNGKYTEGTKSWFTTYWNEKSYRDRQNREWWEKNWKNKMPVPMYAKGTMGTKTSGFAITDESWIGEEITLAAGKNGQLQYLKKGSAVMPADISTNLVEWGKLNPNMMNVGGGANLNMISNAVNKPELNLSFDSLVHVDSCSQDTLKDLEKMVDTKINQFSKQMNYAIKKFK